MKRLISLLVTIVVLLSCAAADSMNGGYERYRKTANESIERYRMAKSTLSSIVYINTILNSTIAKDGNTYNDILELCGQMKDNLNKSIEDMITYVILLTDSLFGENIFDDTIREKDPTYVSMISLFTATYDDAIEKADEKSIDLEKALRFALEDGHMDDAEYKAIVGIVEEMDEIMDVFVRMDESTSK